MHEVATLLHHPFSILPLKNLDSKHESGRFFLLVLILQNLVTLHSSDPLFFFRWDTCCLWPRRLFTHVAMSRQESNAIIYARVRYREIRILILRSFNLYPKVQSSSEYSAEVPTRGLPDMDIPRPKDSFTTRNQWDSWGDAASVAWAGWEAPHSVVNALDLSPILGVSLYPWGSLVVAVSPEVGWQWE